MQTKIWDYAKQVDRTPEEAAQDNERALALMWESVRTGAVDLHMHSNASDGKTSPAQLVQEVVAHDLSAFALTDHDTIAGIEIISMVYDKLGQLHYELPDLIPGLEISAEHEGQEVHVLAYYPAGGIRSIEAYLEERRKDREERNRALCDRARELGMQIEYEELVHEGGYVVGRLHMAQIMIRKAFVASVQEAFDRYLSEGKPCYIKRSLPQAEEAIREIRKTGGVPVLAHPAIYKDWMRGEESKTIEELKQTLARLQTCGLQGIEAVHGESSAQESEVLARIGAELGLLPTVGSDFHGSHKPNVHMRHGREDYRPLLAKYYAEFE